ncbi:MAG: CvpA family protein [candidate division Zixibacteria bacterium]|nr:CvpA family protein [candidate division Zixibacteria bacterium]
MNWIDAALGVLLLASVIVGSKKGLVRESSAFLVFFTAIVLTVNYIDKLVIYIYDSLGTSVLVSAFLSFILLLAFSYGLFKGLGWMFYKVADIRSDNKKRDQMGGALVGFLRGWAAVGFLTFVAFLLPLPDRFYPYFEASFFGPTVAKTVPLIFESTSMLHPNHPSFMKRIENTLVMTPSEGSASRELPSEERADVFQVMYQLDRFFNLEAKKSGT